MRGQDPLGRFTPEYEVWSIKYGIAQDLQVPAGQSILWYRYDPYSTVVDPVYDVGDSSGGRRWVEPFEVPVINAYIAQGETYQNERGLYTVDQLTIVINLRDVERLLPDLITDPDLRLRDRLGFRDEVFEVTRIYPKGQVRYHYTALRIDAVQVKPGEIVNDVDFDFGYHFPTTGAELSVSVNTSASGTVV